MAKDARALRDEAAEATSAGKHKKALAAYLELERLEPRDAQWPKRAGETYRKLNNTKNAIEAFERAADRYAQNGFLVQAIAVCKIILGIDPQHASTLGRLAQMNEQAGQGPTRVQGYADNNPALHQNPNVAALRRNTTHPPPSMAALASSSAAPAGLPPAPPAPPAAPFRAATAPPAPAPAVGRAQTSPSVDRTPPFVSRTATPVVPRTITPLSSPPAGSTPPPRIPAPPVIPAMPPEPRRTKPTDPPGVVVARTRSKPITLAPGAPLDAVTLAEVVPDAYEHSSPGVHVIPIEDEVYVESEYADYADDYAGENAVSEDDGASSPMIEIELPDALAVEGEVHVVDDLELADLDEEIPLAEPSMLGHVAERALAATPLFAGLPKEALEALVENLTLVTLEEGAALFYEGDVGDALYVIVEGEVSVQAEGPPRVEMARLGPGSFIGEVALMTDQPRSATVSAVQPAELLRIDRHTLSRVLADHGDVLRAVLRFVRDRLVDRWMRTSPLFRPFSDEQRHELAARFQFLEIDAQTKLLAAGQRPDGLYIVLAGHYTVQRGGATVAQLGPGDTIGENALLSGGSFKSDVIARGKSLALCLPAAEFREMIMTHPHVLEYVGEQAEHSRRLQIL